MKKKKKTTKCARQSDSKVVVAYKIVSIVMYIHTFICLTYRVTKIKKTQIWKMFFY